MDNTERLMLHNGLNDYKTENNKLTEQVLERDTHIENLDKEIEELKDNVTDLEDKVLDLEEDIEGLKDPEMISNNVEDSISNQLDNLNQSGDTDFESIEELYGKWHECFEKVKEQDEYKEFGNLEITSTNRFI